MPDKEDAARMIIGPESQRTDLLDATDDVIRELVRLRREREHLILAGDALRAENERRYELGLAMAERVAELGAENERLRAALEALVALGEDDGSASDSAWKEAFTHAAKLSRDNF